MNDDTISRQAAIDAFGLSEKTRKYGGDHSGYDTMMLYEIQNTLESLPSAQPEIIRCEDCKHNSLKRMSGNIFCDLGMGLSQLYDFCSKGERKDDAEEES